MLKESGGLGELDTGTEYRLVETCELPMLKESGGGLEGRDRVLKREWCRPALCPYPL